MNLNKQEIVALLRLIDASSTSYTIVANQQQYQELTQKLQDQLSKTETTHSQAEIMLRKKVSDNEKKLASNTGDYDDEVGVIQQTLTEESCIFEDTREKRIMYELGYNDLCGQKHAQC